MGKNKYTYWTSMDKKPKGFSFVKGSSMTYTYEVPIFCKYDIYNKLLDRIFINVKMLPSNLGGVDIDDALLREYLKKEIGVGFSYDQSLFQRDGAAFPFVNRIDVINTDKYLQFKKLKNRRLKLEQIKNKIH